MSSVSGLIEKLTKLKTAPSIQPLFDAANRAATRANVDFNAARVPVHATVTSTGSGVSVLLRQTGRLTKAFAVTPQEILRRHLDVELPRARAELTRMVQGHAK